MTISIKIDGALDIKRALEELGDPKIVRRLVRRVLKQAGQPMVELARSLAPVDEGNLKESIKVEAGKRDRRTPDVTSLILGIDAEVQPAVYYPRQKPRKTATRKFRSGRVPIIATMWRDPGVAGVAWIKEFGTPTKKAQPFMRTAYDREGSATIERFGQLAGPEIEKTAARLAKKRGGA